MATFMGRAGIIITEPNERLDRRSQIASSGPSDER